MSAMEILLIPAVLAALVLFRWARTVALLALGAAVVWFVLILEGVVK